MFGRFGYNSRLDSEKNSRLPPFNSTPFKNIGPPPPFGSPPPFGPPPPFEPPPPFGPPLPMTRESFKEIKQFFILIILMGKPEGITGYQLQDKYNFPRGNMLRTLEELIEKKCVKTRKTVIKGRAQKFYLITDKGKHYLEELKEKWANRFARMSDMAPPERYGNPFFKTGPKMQMIQNIDDFKSKEDALDYFRGMRSSLKTFLASLEKRKENIEITKSELDGIIENIEKMKFYNVDEIKELVSEIQKKLRKDSVNGGT